MIFTSINPTPARFKDQTIAICSWLNLGLHVCSINSEKEIDRLSLFFPHVEFINHGGESGYVPITTILKAASCTNEEVICLCNSDIQFSHSPDALEALYKKGKEGVVWTPRYNFYSGSIESVPEEWGLDTFWFPRSKIDTWQNDKYLMGRTWWDFWFPMRALQKGIDLYKFDLKFCRHEYHSQRWNEKDRIQMSEIFATEFQILNACSNNLSIIVRKIIEDSSIIFS